MMAKYILLFDIPKGMNTLRNRIHRKLKKINAVKLQDSVWSQEKDNLLELAREIKRSGAEAKVLRAQTVF